MGARWLRPLVGRSWRARLSRGAAVLALGALWTAPTFGLLPPLALYNTSESVPPGLYLYVHHPAAAPAPERGDYVAVRDPPHFDLPWLLKRVAEGWPATATAGTAPAGTHRLNGRPMPPPDPDAAALGIPVWKGCGTLGPDEVVLYGRTPDSYDSRYLGPVRDPATCWGVYRAGLGRPLSAGRAGARTRGSRRARCAASVKRCASAACRQRLDRLRGEPELRSTIGSPPRGRQRAGRRAARSGRSRQRDAAPPPSRPDRCRTPRRARSASTTAASRRRRAGAVR